MKFATWNVNSLRVRQPQLLSWLAQHEPDVVAIQETKLEDKNFPEQEIRAAGYQSVFSGQKTYNGVALLSKINMQDVSIEIPGFNDPQRRFIAGTIQGIRVINLYVPNGESISSDKYRYKLTWLENFRNYLAKEISLFPKLLILGDFNIAPEDRDVHNPPAWEGQVLVSEPERQALKAICDLGFQDAFRLFDQPEGCYSWWDYRMGAFRKNHGLRIDLILLSSALKPYCKACHIDKKPRQEDRPSDHTPVELLLDLDFKPIY